VLHRDVSYGNILLLPEPAYGVLVDFNLAIFLDRTGPTTAPATFDFLAADILFGDVSPRPRELLLRPMWLCTEWVRDEATGKMELRKPDAIRTHTFFPPRQSSPTSSITGGSCSSPPKLENDDDYDYDYAGQNTAAVPIASNDTHEDHIRLCKNIFTTLEEAMTTLKGEVVLRVDDREGYTLPVVLLTGTRCPNDSNSAATVSSPRFDRPSPPIVCPEGYIKIK